MMQKLSPREQAMAWLWEVFGYEPPESDRDAEDAMMCIADDIRRVPSEHIARILEDAVMDARRNRGACPMCGGRLVYRRHAWLGDPMEFCPACED